MNEIAYLKRLQLITSFNSMILGRVHEGWQPYFATFMFRHIPGGRSVKKQVMTDEICRVYSKSLTRIIRRPNAPSHRRSLPFLMASPDLPVPKTTKSSMLAVTINDGLHYHGIWVLPPIEQCRIGRDFHVHLHKNRSDYCPPDGPLLDLDVRSMSTPMLAEYTLKQYKRGNADHDDILILPKTADEVRSKPRMDY